MSANPSPGPLFQMLRTLGYTTASLAALSGVTPDAVRRWRRGERQIPTGTLLALHNLIVKSKRFGRVRFEDCFEEGK